MTKTLCTALLMAVLPLHAQTTDRDAVHQAALDYVVAVYESRPELIERSVASDLTKHGFMRQKDGTYRRGQMTYTQLLEVARTWNAKKNQDVSVKDVKVGEVLDQTATATVRASWGTDFMQLAKIDGRWRIVNIVWQTPPPTAKN